MMNKKAGQADTIKRMVLILLGIIAALVLAIVLTVGAAAIDAEDPVYINGKLVAAFQYNGDPREVWVQCTISRVDDLFAEEQVGDLLTNAPTFTTGRNICEFPIDLEPGTYKVRLYVRERNEGAVRLAAFIKNFEIV
ncbi:hypothetical protein O0S10_07390 [Methanocorpusculum sp. MG]|uniref:DUF1616 domain-containing protein n=1 Tax=Methanocorpusculum petauri TaxID=3002863 RepID=A0ABT4IH25_9EURY|nr:hypothetical protein [Methanocorpusculum petauri]MCZ0861047.1 hypothetical protein [Methanocorpusculum petauri]MDE2442980.1 hypothetical protein [Methanocorpusculum sp.]